MVRKIKIEINFSLKFKTLFERSLSIREFFSYGGLRVGLIYSQFCLLASELTAAAVILQYWTHRLQPWQWAIIITVPTFAFQLIHVRAYGAIHYS